MPEGANCFLWYWHIIMVIKCTKCKCGKDVSEFNSGDYKVHILTGTCRKCKSKYAKHFRLTVFGLIKKLYERQKYTSKVTCNRELCYTFKEFCNWILSQKHFYRLFTNWRDSGYEKDLKPTVDRADSKIGYHFGNIQLVTHKYNWNIKGARDKGKPIDQFDLDGNFIRYYYSFESAGRVLGISSTHISRCIKSGKSCKGYIFALSDNVTF